jgi:hypothetical protein
MTKKKIIERTTTYNINDTATVKLTSEGEKVLRAYYGPTAYLTPDGRVPGYNQVTHVYRSELWHVMQIFGRKIYMGGLPMFVENAITIRND